MPLVSVVTAVYNRPDYLDEAIQSIQRQSFSDWEHIIIDDGSSNPTTKEILKRISKHEKIKIIRTRNNGLGSARNHAIVNASGNFILTLDDDDIWSDKFLEMSVKILMENPEVGVVTSWAKLFGHTSGLVKPLGGGVSNFLISNNSVHALFRRDCWDKAGCYDETKEHQAYTDWDLWLRITNLGFMVHVIPEVLFFYRTHHSSMLSEAQGKHIYHFKWLIEKNKEIYSKYLIDALLKFEIKILTLRNSSNNHKIINKIFRAFKLRKLLNFLKRATSFIY